MRVTAIRSIRAFCVECIGGAAYVEECTAVKCQLYPFRMGKNPNISAETKEKSKRRMLDRLAAQNMKTKETKTGGQK
jgi:hypothetical protein